MKLTVRRLSLMLAILIMCSAPFLTALALDDDFPAYSKLRTTTVRVLLTRLGITDRTFIKLDGVYCTGKKGEASVMFKRGSEITILLRSGSMYIYYEGMSWNAGKSLYFTRFQSQHDEENGIRFQDGGNLYEGDLQLDVVDNAIRPILHINIEDYLLGVLPYEMGNGWPIETLKAQAVAARTYALNHVNWRESYDVVDNSNDQVYRGMDWNNTRVQEAVTETKGLCGVYDGALASCFYSASNGGQTEIVEHVWSSRTGDYGYYKMVDDPYDLANPSSRVRRATISKNPAENLSHGMRLLLLKELAPTLRENGYDASPESLRVDEILSLEPVSARYEEPSRLMTKLRVEFKYSARVRHGGDEPYEYGENRKPELSEPDISLFASPTPEPDTPTPSPQSATPTPLPTPYVTPEPQYGEFEKQKEAVTLEIDVFPDFLSVFGLSMNSSPVELVTVVEKKDSFVVEVRRYGHGVGLSQRGAEWMAMRYNMDYQQILSFYYPGMTLMKLDNPDYELMPLDEDLMSTPGPTPTATPKPTIMPLSLPAEAGAWYAVVWDIDDDSTLNLRSAPNMGGSVLMRLFKMQRLLVVERCQEAGWVKVKTDTIEGYVMEKFLKAE